MDFREITAKSILSPCGIPGIDFVINPYTGCRFGCTYCYASFMGRFLKDKNISDWGEYVYAKINAPDLLSQEIKTKFKEGRGKGLEVFLSSVTDPYQPAEAKYKLTRQCLTVLADFGFEGFISILTKSPLVLRDADVFKRFKHVSVGVTVTSTDDAVSRYFEKYAPLVSERFRALKELREGGIETYAFIGPLLPHFVSYSNELEKVFEKLKEVGVRDIFVEHLNLSRYIRGRLVEEMKGVSPEVITKFYESQSEDYRDQLNRIVEDLVKKYKMNLLTGGVIFHKKYQREESTKKVPWKHRP